MKIKVLLINPPIKNMINPEMPLFIRQHEGLFPPLGIMYIAAYLKKFLYCETKILDTIAEKLDYKEIYKYIKNFSPNIVGITAHTHNLVDVILTANLVKSIDKHIHVCLGGPHVSIFPQEAINIPTVDSVVSGEGEEAFAEIVKGLGENSDLRKIKGIIFKQDKETINTGKKEDNVNLDSLPFPNRTLLDYRKYYNVLGKKTIMTTLVSSRGCPYQCSFCSTPKGFYRMRSPENVVNEIEECKRLGIEDMHFVDDTFNVYAERVIAICEEIKKRKLNIKWSFRGRIDKITEPLLRAVKSVGCYRINLGVETSTDEGLKRLNKGITIEQIRQVFKWTRSNRINTVAYFLIGCPHEKNYNDIMNTISFSKELNPDFVLFNILTVYPGTELYKEGLQKGIFKNDHWKDFVSHPRKDFKLQFWEEWFSRRQLVKILNLAYCKFYLRPKLILRIINSTQIMRLIIKKLN